MTTGEVHPETTPGTIDGWILVDDAGAPVPIEGTHGAEIELFTTKRTAAQELAEALRDEERIADIRPARLTLL